MGSVEEACQLQDEDTFEEQPATAPSYPKPKLPTYLTRRFTQRQQLPHARSSIFHSDILSISKIKVTSSTITTIVPLILILATLLVPVYLIPFIVDGQFPGGNAFLPLALSAISILPAISFLGWCKYSLNKSFSLSLEEEDEPKNSNRWKDFLSPSIEGFCFPLAILLRHIQLMLPFYIEEGYQEIYTVILNEAGK